jgi:hypothetical protein
MTIRTMGLAAAATLALMLGACTATPLYGPQASERSSGYSEQKLDETHYRVTFTGRRSTSRARVEDALMLRAAEVTVAAGYTHFVIDKRETEQESARTALPVYADPFFFPYYGYHGRYAWYDPFWYPFGRFASDFDDRRYVAYADIAMLNAEAARANAEAVEAAAVIANLRAKVAPPPSN